MSALNSYTLPELKQLNARISRELDKRQAEAKSSLLKRLRQLARDEGVALEDVLGATPVAAPPPSRTPSAAKSANAPAPVKYRNPNDLKQSWSGRGRRPAWVEAWLANGGTLDALENAAANAARRRRFAAPATPTTTPAA